MSNSIRLTTFVLLLALSSSLGCSRSKDPEKFLAKANQYFEAKDYEKAKIEYLNALRLQPTNAVAILKLGKIYYRQGQIREAYPFLLESRKRSPDDLEAATQLGTIFMLGRDFAKARAEANAVLTQAPTNEMAAVLLADSAQSPEEIQETLRQLDDLQKKAGDRAVFHAARSQFALRAKDLKTAEVELQKALTLDPKSVLANIMLGVLRWSQGQTNQAEQAFRTAAQMAPAEDAARFRLATFLLRTGRLEEAKKVLDEINRDTPERTGAWTARAEIALAEQQYDECGRLLNRALAQAPNDFDARALQAQLKLAQKKPDEALPLLESLAEKNPRSSEVHYRLGLAQLLNQQLTPAIASFNKSATLDTNNISAVLMLAQLELARGQAAAAINTLTDLVRRAPDLERAQAMLGQAYAGAGRPDDALAVYRSMRTRFPKNATVPYQMGLLLLQKRQEAEARKAFDEARSLAPNAFEPLEQLVRLDLSAKAPAQALARLQPQMDRLTNSAPLWLLRAQIYAAETNKNGTIQSLEKAIEIQPDLQAAYLMLANLYIRTGQPKESLEQIEDLLKKNPANLTALVLKGILHAQLDQIDEAQSAYEAALKVNPNFVLALNNLAYILGERRNRVDEAYVHAAKAHQLKSDDPAITDTLGWLEYRRGKYPEALRLLIESREKLPNEPEVAYHLGMTQYMMGNEEAARLALTEALKSPAKYSGREVAEQRLAVLTKSPGISGEAQIAALEKQSKSDPKDFLAVLRLGTAYEAAGDSARAREAYEAALKLNPAAFEVVSRLAALEVDHDPARATELARQAQKLAPNDPSVTYTLGRLALKNGDAITAYGLLQSSSRTLTNQSTVWADLALAAFGTGRLKEAGDRMNDAIKLGLPSSQANGARSFIQLVEIGQNPATAATSQNLIEAALKADPANGPALYAAALGLEQQGKYAESRDTHEKLLKQYPAFILSTRQLAILYADRLKDDAKAYEMATKARTELPKDDALAKTLGELALRRGDFRYAVQLLSEVARTLPKDANLQFQLGLAHLRLKQLPEGRAALERAIALDPKAAFIPEAKKLLEENKAG